MHAIQKVFYRNNGVRFPSAIVNGAPFQLTELPKDVVFHTYSDADHPPDVDTHLSIFQGYSKKILVAQITEYVNPIGTYRHPGSNMNTLTQNWRKKNNKLWGQDIMPWKTASSPEQLAVVNYGYLDTLNLYQTTQMAAYYQWANRWGTIWSTMNFIANESGKNHYIVIQLPEQLQGKTILDKYLKTPVNLTAVTVFGMEPGMPGFMLLDLWKWVSPEHRAESLLSRVDPKNYGKINLVFQSKQGRQRLINLAYLNSWIEGQPNTSELASVQQYDFIKVQKLFLGMAMSMNAITDQVDEAAAESTLAAIKQNAAHSEDGIDTSGYQVVEEEEVDDGFHGDGAQVAINELHASSDATKPKQFTSKDPDAALERRIAENELAAKKTAEKDDVFASIEDDIAALDQISLEQLKIKGLTVSELVADKQVEEGEAEPAPAPIDLEAIKETLTKTPSPSEAAMKMLDEQAKANIISAAEYRKLAAGIVEFENSPDPYGSKLPRKEAEKIKPEDLILKPEMTELASTDATPDKTMASSSLAAYNKQYMRHVMHKDVMKVISDAQRRGIIIKKHEISTTVSALGTYEQHRIELKPIKGQSSAFVFTLPKVEEDGTFMAGGSKYRLRIQRTDLPIRKIAPAIVALSSYTGKTFVQTSERVARDTFGWVVRQINLAIVTEGSFIQNVAPADVYNSEDKTPFIYGLLAKDFQKLSAGGIDFFFHYFKRAEFYKDAFHVESDLKDIERNGRVFCGVMNRNTRSATAIVVTPDNRFLSVGYGNETDLGDIFSVLKLDRSDAPQEFSEIRVFSKYIPVGIVLAYYIGFRALVALTGIQYRIVPARKNKDLQQDEFVVQFKDEAYVFKNTDRKASLLLGGFADYDKLTRIYESKLFDHKDVYLNLLLSRGMRSIYIRELDAMDEGFIDSVTMEILEEMGEPTNFRGLLLRANELLLTYHHPVSQDRSVMRDRGYERFAGTVHKVLSQGIRAFNNKNNLGKSKIDISPFEVWNTIMKDAAIKVVEDINPIQNLKEQEVITFAGAGGRDKDTMTKPTRAYHINDHGLTSESTVDSSGVGTIAYLSADPNITNVRGLMAKEKKLNSTTIMSTAALVSPCSFTDN